MLGDFLNFPFLIIISYLFVFACIYTPQDYLEVRRQFAVTSSLHPLCIWVLKIELRLSGLATVSLVGDIWFG